MVNQFYKVTTGDFFVEANMLNHMNILHGGELFKHCDSTVGLLASKYSKSRVMTVSVKRFDFKQKSYQGQLIRFCITLLQTSQKTMTFYISIKARELDDTKETVIGTSVMTFVAVDQNLKPITVEPFIVDDKTQKKFIEEIKQEFHITDV